MFLPIWADRTRDLLRDQEFLTWVGILCGFLVFGALLFRSIQLWRKRLIEPEQPDDSLGSYRSMLEKGELTEAEYRRILERVAQRLKGKPVPQAPPAQPLQQDPPPETPTDRPS